MQIELMMKTARSAVIKIEDGGLYNTKTVFSIYVNDIFWSDTDKVITNIFGLKPNCEYKIQIYLGKLYDEIIFVTDSELFTLNVRDFGAKGDGVNDDTTFIQAAVLACPKSSRVLIPKGTYRITSIFLKSNINIEIQKDAILLAEDDRNKYPIFPGLIESYDESKEYNLGTWEGNPLKMFSGIITGVDIENVVIYGEGLINGNASYHNWWYNEKVMRIAFRPRLIFLNNCRNVSVQGIHFCDSPTWTIHPYFSSNLAFYAIDIKSPIDSPNTDGLNPESCKDVLIVGTHFSLGDDCIAVKSGKIYMGSKYKVPCTDILVSHCLMENGHGGVTVGSEMAAGIRNLVVEDCVFKNTDRGLRVKTRRGRGKDAIIDNIILRRNVMDNVKIPFVVNCFYFCDPDGRTKYVQTREAQLVEEKTPLIKKLSFSDITCNNCHIAAAFFYGLPEKKIECIEMENITIDYSDEATSGMPAMLNGIDSCSKKGILACNINCLTLKNVKISGHVGEKVEHINVDKFSFN